MGKRLHTTGIRRRFETALRVWEAADGVERVDQAGWWGEADIDGQRYQVHVLEMGSGRVHWSMHRAVAEDRARFVCSGDEATAASAWWAGYCAVADDRAILDTLDELDRVEPGSDAEAAVYDRLRVLVGEDEYEALVEG